MKPLRIVLSICGFVGLLATASGALACSGARPAPGAIISGPVLAVPDGRTVCIALGPNPSQWIPLKLAGPTDETSARMVMAALFAKRLSCVVDARGEGHCLLGAEAVDDVLRQPGLTKIAQSWR